MKARWAISACRARADLVVVAPATADIMAKLAHGLADDLATTTLLATSAPVLLAPSMNVLMWQNAATQANVATLKARHIRMVGPDAGDLACGEVGSGRMAEPHDILNAIETLLADATLKGLKALVTSGPTFEPIDPVRYIANRSSGKQGHAIAAALARMGAETTLVSGPTRLPDPPGVTTRHIETAAEMLAACEASLPVDVGVFAAAVADWKVARARQPEDQEGRSRAHADAGTCRQPGHFTEHVACRSQAPEIGDRLCRRDRESRSPSPRRSWSGRAATGSWRTTSRRIAAPSAATATPFIS